MPGRVLLRALLLLAALTPGTLSCGAGVPPVIRDELDRAPPGVVTVVFFTDFQCPHCRRTHAALAAAAASRPGRVRVVTRHVPLHMHPDAQTAARAAVCVESSTAYDDYLHALYAAPDLGEVACEELAAARGVNRDAFRACVADPATDRRIASDTRLLDQVGGDGVPLLYVGRRRLEGSQTQRDLASAIDEAARQ